jgi:hypothetical protein
MKSFTTKTSSSGVAAFEARVSLLLLAVGYHAAALSHSVSFPILSPYTAELNQDLKSSFQSMVDSTSFMEQGHSNDVFKVPLFGDDCVVTFQATNRGRTWMQHHGEDDPSEYVLRVDGASKDDFGWICFKVGTIQKIHLCHEMPFSCFH